MHGSILIEMFLGDAVDRQGNEVTTVFVPAGVSMHGDTDELARRARRMGMGVRSGPDGARLTAPMPALEEILDEFAILLRDCEWEPGTVLP